ncbi:MAG: phosphoribosyltransferase [Nitrososphaera sp.]
MQKRSNWKGKHELTWADIDYQVKILVDKIKKTGFEFDKIATVARGGLIPARLVADQFNIKKILVDRSKIYGKTLFVDDIYDTGNTFKKVISRVIDKKTLFLPHWLQERG